MFTETATITPSLQGLGITHQPHGGGDGAKCGAKFADTPHVINVKVTRARQTRKETGQHLKKYISCVLAADGGPNTNR